MSNVYTEYKEKKQSENERAEQLKNIGDEVAKLIVNSDVAINEVWTILHHAKDKIMSTTKATI